MPFVYLVIIGAAAGFLATRIMRVEADIATTLAVGIFGALIGGFVLRFLVVAMGAAAGFAGALAGAFLLVWLLKAWRR